MNYEPQTWTDEFGRTWYRLELVDQPEINFDVSDATLAFVLAVVCLVPGLLILLASVIWGVPGWLGGPVAGALLLFGLASLLVSTKEEGS